MRFVLVGAAVSAIIGSPADGKEPCPPNKYGSQIPWLIETLMPGDDFAEVYLDIDKAGRPINCRMGRNNIDGDNKFFVCKALMEQWSTAPAAFNPTAQSPSIKVPAGSQVKATVYRQYVAYGADHQKAEKKARREFFKQHPEERPECYPDEN